MAPSSCIPLQFTGDLRAADLDVNRFKVVSRYKVVQYPRILHFASNHGEIDGSETSLFNIKVWHRIRTT